MSIREQAYRALAAKRPRPVPSAEPAEAFAERLSLQGGHCVRVADLSAARRWLADFIGSHGADEACTTRLDGWCAPILETPDPELPLRLAGAREQPRVGLCSALAAVAETGSVLLHPGKDSPLALAFLSTQLVVLLRQQDVVDSLEMLWSRVRECVGDDPPRALSLVSGPSTSGDIAMQFATGVHGPVSLHVLMVEEA